MSDEQPTKMLLIIADVSTDRRLRRSCRRSCWRAGLYRCVQRRRASFDEALPPTDAPAISGEQERVAPTLAAIPPGEIGYAEFLRRIICAGWARAPAYS